MKSKIIYGILAIVLALSLSACGSAASYKGTSNNETVSSYNSKSPADPAAVNEAYNGILSRLGITPHSGDDTDSTGYSIEDIIGDTTPELIIYDEGGITKDIYGYDNKTGEAFQYKGETQIESPKKGKDVYCVSVGGDDYLAIYSIYKSSGDQIQFVQKFEDGNDPFGTPGEITYTVGTENVSEDQYKNEIYKYMDSAVLPEDTAAETSTGKSSNAIYNAQQFTRADYSMGVSREDLLRYTDKYMGSKVFLEQYQIAQVSQPKIYYAKSVALDGGSEDYILIDDTNDNIGNANAVVGDLVSVYGVFSGTSSVNVTNSDGNQESILIPNINTDLLVINSILPKPEDFASVMVDSLNAQLRYDSQSQSQYISGSTIKLASAIGSIGDIWIPTQLGGPSIEGVSTYPLVHIDGYHLYIFLDYKDNEYESPSTGGILKDGTADLFKDFTTPRPTGTNDDVHRPIWMTGNITSITNNSFDSAILNVVIDIKKIETREVSTGG